MIVWLTIFGQSTGRMGVEAWLSTKSHQMYNTLSSKRHLASWNINDNPISSPRNIGIIGGGLAGLSTAYHLLQKAPNTNITIFDKELPGSGGASAVAGGLLHPLSPKGKLVYLGLEGLAATNHLIKVACQFRDQKDCLMSNEIYRIATNQDHVTALMETANNLPNLTEWLLPEQLPWDDCPKDVLGALRLHSGCMVVHMPSYLGGLWQAIANTSGIGIKKWCLLEESMYPSEDGKYDWNNILSEFDTVILSAGSGLFQDCIVEQKLPIQLVRGQSVEMTHTTNSNNHAMLCGKYVSPLPQNNRVLIGATHEFNKIPLEPDEVISELRTKTNSFASHLWDNGTIDKITSGYRVQSNRGKYGRIPILGKLDVTFHSNVWIYTGLSSRGLLHHGIFGEILASKILQVDAQHDVHNLDWWK